jgi:RiboL-PSP-HEPN
LLFASDGLQALPDEDQIPVYLRTQTERFVENIVRVERLINLHSVLADIAADIATHSAYDASDVLRSAVVLLHATLEDLIRTIASAHLPRSDSELIKKIPLTGMPRSGKYTIADLIQHRGKTIDAVLDESINQWLETHSFNHAADVRGMLTELEMPVDYFAQNYEKLDQMIKRRHLIVHRADRRNDGAVTPITPDEVKLWAENVHEFMRRMIYQLQFVPHKPDESK